MAGRPTSAGGAERSPREKRRRLVLFALAYGGFAFLSVQLIVGATTGLFPIPGGDELIWDRVGDAIWTGAPVYFLAPVLTESFFYAPPVAVIFGFTSWLAVEDQHWLFTVLRVASLRVIGGSWIGAGIACWFPLVAFELGGGNFNIVLAAGIVAAVYRRPELAVITAFCKFSPALAIHPSDWRRVAVIVTILVAITIPWLHLWPEYLFHMIGSFGRTIGPQIPVPLWARLLLAAAVLIVFRSRWGRALAATLAIPAFYWGSLVVLIAPVAVWIRDRDRHQGVREAG